VRLQWREYSKGIDMINPNKLYNSKVLGTVISHDSHSSRWFKVQIASGQVFEGYLQSHERKELPAIGSVVRFGCTWSITGDQWLIRSVRVQRVVNVRTGMDAVAV
jgi:hypothetical protein